MDYASKHGKFFSNPAWQNLERENGLVNQVEILGLACGFATSVTLATIATHPLRGYLSRTQKFYCYN